ncbi:MAG: hypothetical protein J6J23_03210 [Clostridia bacterium]|nr:hypothetical protein [Clostridia bacterium]
MKKYKDELSNSKVVKNFNLSEGIFNLINGLTSLPSQKCELLCFAYEFIVNGKLIDISKDNDAAIDKLYPVCRSLRLSSQKL